jgi:anti-sigma28 factor (negative regulator of flagellin synthesis)
MVAIRMAVRRSRETRRDRVAAVRRAIKAGTYRPTGEAIAAKLVAAVAAGRRLLDRL